MFLADAEITVNFASAILFGIICALIAHSRGRNVIAWVLLGLFLQCIALVLILILPDLKAEESKQQRNSQENRRLREQLRKERQISDQRHQHIESRLGQHDQALGMDTSQPPELTQQTLARLTGGSGNVWYYARDTDRKGPVSLDTLRHLYEDELIGPETLVWTEGMEDWDSIESCDPFRGDPA